VFSLISPVSAQITVVAFALEYARFCSFVFGAASVLADAFRADRDGL